jgi:hypothetical protein
MVYYQNKNPKLGKFRRALDWKMLIYLDNGHLMEHLVHFVLIWNIFSVWVPCNMKNLATLPLRRCILHAPAASRRCASSK